MATSFGPETPVLSYGPRPHADPGGRNDREWLLWPAWAFRVVAPEPRPRGVNLLQKAVLGVLRASRLTAAELGAHLGVHPELAAFVVTELQTERWIDAAWTVTRRGIEVLEEDRELSTKLVPGWVFRDPWNGNLWPFVASSLEYAPTELDERGYPVLLLGSTGRPWRQSAWMQFPPGGRGGALPDGGSGDRTPRRPRDPARRPPAQATCTAFATARRVAERRRLYGGHLGARFQAGLRHRAGTGAHVPGLLPVRSPGRRRRRLACMRSLRAGQRCGVAAAGSPSGR